MALSRLRDSILNVDKPYVQFIREQIAGDVLWPETRDGIEGLGFIAAGPWDFIGHAEVAETKIDGKIARHLDRDDMISNAIGTFCSVTSSLRSVPSTQVRSNHTGRLLQSPSRVRGS